MARPKPQIPIIDHKIRLPETLKADLDAAAREHGKSMNAEMVDRLTASFSGESNVRARFGADPIYALLRGVSVVMQRSGGMAAFLATKNAAATARWWENPYAYKQATAAALRLIEALAPEGDSSPPVSDAPAQDPTQATFDALVRDAGVMTTNGLLFALRGAAEGRDGLGDLEALAYELNKDLGALGARVRK
jgi:plasmid stability protein